MGRNHAFLMVLSAERIAPEALKPLARGLPVLSSPPLHLVHTLPCRRQNPSETGANQRRSERSDVGVGCHRLRPKVLHHLAWQRGVHL